MKHGMVGLAALAVVACLPGLSEAGRRCGGHASSCGYVSSCGYAASSGYQYVTTYKKEKQKVWVYQPVTVMEDREVLECMMTSRDVDREYQVLEEKVTTRKEKRMVYWCELEAQKQKVKSYRPVTVMQPRELVEWVPVTRNVKQTVQEMERVITPTDVERVWTTYKQVATPVVRDVVRCMPQVVEVPPSCCNPCGSTCVRMVRTVSKETVTEYTCVPEVHRAKEKINVVSWKPVTRDVMVPVTTCERQVRKVNVPVCTLQESTEEINVMVPVRKSREETVDVQVCNLVPRTVKEKVKIWEPKQVSRKVKVPVVHCERVEREVEVLIPVTTCVPVAPSCAY
jgi:hypothetical protein